jgi:hypothetical protein
MHQPKISPTVILSSGGDGEWSLPRFGAGLECTHCGSGSPQHKVIDGDGAKMPTPRSSSGEDLGPHHALIQGRSEGNMKAERDGVKCIELWSGIGRFGDRTDVHIRPVRASLHIASRICVCRQAVTSSGELE